MASFPNSTVEYLGVYITMRSKFNYSDVVNLYVTSQHAVYDNAPFLTLPILQSLSGIGTAMNRFTPQQTTGTVRIDNSKDLFAYQKRFSDLLSRYALIGATVKIYTALTSVIDLNFFENAQILWTGEVKSFNYATDSTDGSQVLTFNIGKIDEEHIVTKQLTKQDFNFLPDKSRNQVLPLVLGDNVQVRPVFMEQGNGNEQTGIRVAYATNLAGTTIGHRFYNVGIRTVLVADLLPDANKEAQKRYYAIGSTPYTTPIYPQTSGVVTNQSNLRRVKAYPIGWIPNVTASYLVTGGRFFIRGNGGAGTPQGQILIKVHASDQFSAMPRPYSEAIASATIEKSNYQSFYNASTASLNPVEFVFDKPIPIVGPRPYFISFEGSNEDVANSLTNYVSVPLSNVSTGFQGVRVDDSGTANDNTQAWKLGTGSLLTGCPMYELYGMQFSDEPAGYQLGVYAPNAPDGQGLNVSTCALQYNVFSKTFLRLDDITDLDMIFEIGGLADTDNKYGAGSGVLINTLNRQVQTLFTKYDGTKWVDTYFDASRFSSTHDQYTNPMMYFYRILSGRTDQVTTNMAIIAELMANSYSALTYDAFGVDGKYSLYAWGKPYTSVVRTLTDDDARFTRYYANGSINLINSITINFDRKLDGKHFQKNNDVVDYQEYAQTYRLHYNDTYLGLILSNLSFKLYGEQEYPNNQFKWLSHLPSAQKLAELFIRMHDKPDEYVEATINYSEDTEIKLLDVYRLISTELPSIYGTDNNLYDSSQECNIFGTSGIKAQTFLAMVVGVGFNFQRGQKASIRVLFRLLTHQNEPTFNYSPEL